MQADAPIFLFFHDLCYLFDPKRDAVLDRNPDDISCAFVLSPRERLRSSAFNCFDVWINYNNISRYIIKILSTLNSSAYSRSRGISFFRLRAYSFKAVCLSWIST